MKPVRGVSALLLGALAAASAIAAPMIPDAGPGDTMAAPPQAQADPDGQTLGQIIALLRAGQREKAKELLAAFLITRGPHPLALEIQGTVALEENRLDDAEEALRKALAAAPDSASAMAKLGDVLLRRGDLPGGRALLNQALSRDASQAHARLQLARLESRLGNYGAAITHYRRLISGGPGDGDRLTPFHIELADLYNRTKQYRETRALIGGRISDDLPAQGKIEALRVAIAASVGLKDRESAEKELNRIAALLPPEGREYAVLAAMVDLLKGEAESGARRLRAAIAQAQRPDPALHLALARLHAGSGNARAAAESFRAAIDAMPRDADPVPVVREFAEAMMNAGERATAERAIREYAARYPEHPRLAVMAASLLAGRGDHAGALSRLKEIEAAGHDLAELHDLRTQIFLGTGRRKEALESIRRAVQLDPHNINYWMTYSSIAHEEGGHRLMAQVVAEGLKANPGHPDLLHDLALADDEEGRKDEANRRFREILQTNPQHVPTLVALARNLSAVPAMAEEARRLIAAALQLRPDDPGIKAEYAMILHWSGDHRAAIAILESVVRAVPRDAGMHYRLASVYRAAGDMEKARAAARTALALGLRGAAADELRALAR